MKVPSYTCDHCGIPVGLHDSRCSGCGKVFDAVRCPKCGHQGAPKSFALGCPSCRYLAPVAPRSPRPRASASLFTPLMLVLVGFLIGALVIMWVLRAR